MVLTRATVAGPAPMASSGTADDDARRPRQHHDLLRRPEPDLHLASVASGLPARSTSLDADGDPVATGKLIEGGNGGMATWADLKVQARDMLGIELTDADVGNVPLLATDRVWQLHSRRRTASRRSSAGIGHCRRASGRRRRQTVHPRRTAGAEHLAPCAPSAPATPSSPTSPTMRCRTVSRTATSRSASATDGSCDRRRLRQRTARRALHRRRRPRQREHRPDRRPPRVPLRAQPARRAHQGRRARRCPAMLDEWRRRRAGVPQRVARR